MAVMIYLHWYELTLRHNIIIKVKWLLQGPLLITWGHKGELLVNQDQPSICVNNVMCQGPTDAIHIEITIGT